MPTKTKSKPVAPATNGRHSVLHVRIAQDVHRDARKAAIDMSIDLREFTELALQDKVERIREVCHCDA